MNKTPILLLKSRAEDTVIKIPYHSLEIKSLKEDIQSGNSQIYLIQDFPNDNQLLEQFIQYLGVLIHENRNVDGEGIFEVKVQKKNQYFTSFANTPYYFSLHTDCSDFEHIPQGLAMLCVRQSQEGGESLLLGLEDLLEELSKEEITFLTEKNWSFRGQERPILTEVDGGGYSICYSRLMLETYNKLSDEELDFLNSFDATLRSLSSHYLMQEGDLLLLRNDKVLHGRTDFDEDSSRLIKRIRFRL